ncbi:MAG: T9SS type A sorting domain-containing protein [Candidatus Azobacteroides sp.]|nr:T9SS type A sorting domain-containing protein [Candidatus Azobacteroides sp.]
MRKIATIFFLLHLTGCLCFSYATEGAFIRDLFENASLYSWYIPADHETGKLISTEKEGLIIRTSGEKDWCTLNREIRMDFNAHPDLGIRIPYLPENVSFHMKVERLANADEVVFLDPASVSHPLNSPDVYVWNVKQLLTEKSYDLFQQFKIQLVFEYVWGEQEINVKWICSAPYFIEDTFTEGSVHSWYIPEDHGTGRLDLTENGNLSIKTSGEKDWCTLNREIEVDFEHYPDLLLKISELPGNISFHLKIENLADHTEFVVLQPVGSSVDENQSGVYQWNVKELLTEKNIRLHQNFKIQLTLENIVGKQSVVVNGVRSEVVSSSGEDRTADYLSQHEKIWHLIMYGQSLSEGSQSYPALSTESLPRNYVIGEQVWIGRGNYNLDRLTPLKAQPSLEDRYMNFEKNRQSIAKCENALIGATNHIRQVLGNETTGIIATSSGKDGKTVEELSKESQHAEYVYGDFLLSLQAIKEIMNRNEVSLFCPAIFWMQGESNYDPLPGLTPGSIYTNEKETYQNLLLALKNNMQADIRNTYQQVADPLFITYQTGGNYIRNEQQTISMAQLEASNRYDDIICAGPVYPVPDRNGHLDPNGYRWYGEMLGKVFYKKVVLQEDFKPLQPRKIVKESAQTLSVEFLVPEPPLVFDTEIIHMIPDYGFSIKDNAGKKSIISLEIEGNKVRITCDAPFTGEITLSYAGEEFQGHGSLRDSDPYTGYYAYENLDRKDEQGQFIFTREDSESTLTPAHDPSSLYGKRYPLYNFCVNFYYRIPEGETEYHVPYLSSPPVNINKTEKVNPLSVTYTNNRLFITGGSTLEKKVEVYNLYGKCILNTLCEEQLDVSFLPAGGYIIQVRSGEEKIATKVLK